MFRNVPCSGFYRRPKKKKLRRKVNMLQCPSSLKQINFKMECFSSLSDKPSLYYKNRGDLLQHSVVTTQSRNSRAVALSTYARLRFNWSMSSLLGAFDSIFGLVVFVLKSLLGIARQWSREKFAIYRTWTIKDSVKTQDLFFKDISSVP